MATPPPRDATEWLTAQSLSERLRCGVDTLRARARYEGWAWRPDPTHTGRGLPAKQYAVAQLPPAIRDALRSAAPLDKRYAAAKPRRRRVGEGAAQGLSKTRVGQRLERALARNGLLPSDLVGHGISVSAIYDVLNHGRRLMPAQAAKLATVFGDTTEDWLVAQARDDARSLPAAPRAAVLWEDTQSIVVHTRVGVRLRLIWIAQGSVVATLLDAVEDITLASWCAPAVTVTERPGEIIANVGIVLVPLDPSAAPSLIAYLAQRPERAGDRASTRV